MDTITVEVGGIPWEVHFHFEKEIQPTWYDPGQPQHIQIDSLSLDGRELPWDVADSVIQHLEDVFIEEILEQYNGGV